MTARILALVAVLTLVGTACGPDEPEGPDLSRYAVPAAGS
jgi:hypothetical protein